MLGRPLCFLGKVSTVNAKVDRPAVAVRRSNAPALYEFAMSPRERTVHSWAPPQS